MRKDTPAPGVWFPTIRAGTGADVYTERLAAGLEARGIRTQIAWLPHRAEYAPWTVPVPQPPSWANIVHVNSWLPRRFWPRALPCVVTVHHLVHDPAYSPYRSASQATYHKWVIQPRERQAIRSAHAVTSVSDYVRSTVQDFSGRTTIHVIPNWVDADIFTPDLQRRREKGEPFRLFIAGSRTRRKGFDLLPGFAQALGPAFDVRYAGGVSRGAGGIRRVVDLGWLSQSQLLREYQACDAVVSLSRYEGFGYTALEAMACGKPFIGFSTSGLSEVVDGDCAMLVDIGDVDALVRSCRKLADDPALVERLGSNGRRRAVTQFSAERSIESYSGVYGFLFSERAVSRIKCNT